MDMGQPPQANEQHKRIRQLLGVDALMFISILSLFIIIILSTFAHRSSSRFIRYGLTILSQTYIPLVTYTITATDYIEAPSPLLIVSAALLQLIYKNTSGRVKKKIVIHVKDSNDDTDAMDDYNPVERLADLGWLGFLIVNSKTNTVRDDNNSIKNDLVIPAGLTLILSFIKVSVSALANKLAIQSFAVGRNATLVATYMNEKPTERCPEDIEDYGEAIESQSRFMSSYSYLVMGEEKQQRIITANGYDIKTGDDLVTVDKIWTCNGVLLRADEKNREVCFSFALFKLLRRRLEGEEMAEANSDRSFDLVDRGPFKDPKRAFRIIKAELGFLNDYLYTQLPFTYYGWFPILNILICFLFLLCFTYIGIRVLERLHAHDSYLRAHYRVLGRELGSSERTCNALLYLDVCVFLIILSVTACTEVWEVFTYLLSNQFKVALLSKYVQHQQNPRLSWVLSVFHTKSEILELRPKKLNQCSLYEEDWKKKSIEVPDEVKSVIIEFLRKNRHGLSTDGYKLLIQNYEVGIPQATQACGLESHTERILVWHRVTSLCDGREAGKPSETRTVASILSKYCAYLVNSVPELLPDKDEWTRSLVGNVKTRHFEGSRCSCAGMLNCTRCDMEGSRESPPVEAADNVLRLGKELGEQVRNYERRWQLLADLWVQITLHASLSNNVDAHCDHIGRGSEFITHLWALLSHVGIN